MNIVSPLYLWLLLCLLPALVLFLWWTWIRRQRAIRDFVPTRLLKQLTIGVSTPRQLLKRVIMVLAVAALLVTLARPRWGQIEQETQGSGLDIVVCFDVSRSMLAADLKPNRLMRAKLAAYELLSMTRTDRLGLVAFAGSAFLQCPLALDPEAFRQSVGALDTEVIPDAGTTIGEAIREARTAFVDDSQATRVIVIFTDGEDHEPGAIEAAARAQSTGIRVFTVGVGSAEGDLLRTSDPFGNVIFLRDETGNVIRSRLDEEQLKAIAETGGGFYVSLQSPQAMEHLYQRGLEVLPKGGFAGTRLRQWQERYQWPLALGLLLLLIEVLIPEARKEPTKRPGALADDSPVFGPESQSREGVTR